MVSADHSHTFSIGAYGARGENIFGTGKQQSPDGENVMILGTDSYSRMKFFNFSGYANGPGYNIHEKKNNQECVQKNYIIYLIIKIKLNSKL